MGQLPAERAFYEALADGRTLTRYDKPGCGLSERTSSRPYSPAEELDALRAVVAAAERDLRADLGPVHEEYAGREPALIPAPRRRTTARR